MYVGAFLHWLNFDFKVSSKPSSGYLVRILPPAGLLPVLVVSCPCHVQELLNLPHLQYSTLQYSTVQYSTPSPRPRSPQPPARPLPRSLPARTRAPASAGEDACRSTWEIFVCNVKIFVPSRLLRAMSSVRPVVSLAWVTSPWMRPRARSAGFSLQTQVQCSTVQYSTAGFSLQTRGC